MPSVRIHPPSGVPGSAPVLTFVRRAYTHRTAATDAPRISPLPHLNPPIGALRMQCPSCNLAADDPAPAPEVFHAAAARRCAVPARRRDWPPRRSGVATRTGRCPDRQPSRWRKPAHRPLSQASPHTSREPARCPHCGDPPAAIALLPVYEPFGRHARPVNGPRVAPLHRPLGTMRPASSDCRVAMPGSPENQPHRAASRTAQNVRSLPACVRPPTDLCEYLCCARS